MVIASCSTSGPEIVKNDPMNTRIYTLDNGLKVYMSVNKAEPRIQTYIAVKVGAKNDPSETTGLAHYFEHLMFKGTESVGTQNYELEKPLLDEIESKFEYYRTLTDENERSAVYGQIDSLSYEASKISIPNEYDKLMATIGASGTNAYTGFDMTVYTEDIPSNQIENWAKIQSDRFKHNVIRGFHTELETVYEEKNMSLTSDSRKSIEAISSMLFKNHPYGTQTVLGTQDHLKNPSITNIKAYYKNWYVPNNMAICLSGDFDPDYMIATIKKYFGDMVPNNGLKRLEVKPEEEITEPIHKDVYGLEAENLLMGWRFNGINSLQADTLDMVANILSNNGSVGLIDKNITQEQKALSAWGGIMAQADYNVFILGGTPKQGQTLDELKGLLLGQLDELKGGNFDESLLEATINNIKRDVMMQLESNSARADMYVDAFINSVPWKQYVGKVERLSKITKEDIVKFANLHFGNNYAEVYKLQGQDNTVKKISKPKITPVFTNRDTMSSFLKEIQASTVTPIEPVFVDFDKDMKKMEAKQGIEVLYTKNVTNSLFSLTFIYNSGFEKDQKLDMAINYASYLGTSKYSANEINSKFYDLACDYSINPSADRTRITISGLSENMEEALKLLEEIVYDYQPDEAVLENMKIDVLQSRINAKKNQSANFSALQYYVRYGAKNAYNHRLSNEQLGKTTSEELLGKFSMFKECAPVVLYYGPMESEKVVEIINREHKCNDRLKQLTRESSYSEQVVDENRVYIAPYDAKQIYMLTFSNKGDKYNHANSPVINLYNEYFGGGMNGIVFQEMREARGLAYTARASYSLTDTGIDTHYSFSTFIATQNDKLMDALNAFDRIIEEMPQSEAAFGIAKENIIARMRTQRVTKENILYSYLTSKDLGISEDRRKILFETIPSLTMDDIVKFQQEVIKGRKYYVGILGKESDLDLKALNSNGASYGRVIRLTQEDIFGF